MSERVILMLCDMLLHLQVTWLLPSVSEHTAAEMQSCTADEAKMQNDHGLSLLPNISLTEK